MSNNPINSCDGYFTDSGGNSGNYTPNSNLTTIICSDGSEGTHIRLNFSGTDIDAADHLCFFDGTNATAPSLGCSSDYAANAAFIIQASAANTSGCITVTFTSDASIQGSGWSAAISCIPACQTIQALITSTTPAIMPVDTGYIDVCPNQRVFFNGAGSYPQNNLIYNHSDLTSSFEWNFGDGIIGYGPNVTHIYEDPGGYIVSLTITDQFGCTNTNYIKQRLRVSTSPDFEILRVPHQICSGDTISLNSLVNQMDTAYNLVVNPIEGTFPTGGIRSDSLPMPDGNGASYQTSINFTDFGPGQFLTNVNDLISICAVMEHSYMRDIEIKLTCPDNTTVTLHNFAGTTGGQVFLGEPYEDDEGQDPIPGLGYEYCWTPTATNGTFIEYANANLPGTLPAGNYESFTPLSNLVGCPLNGDWTIKVTDSWPIDNGYIFSWSINFAPSLFPNVETFTPTIIDWAWINNPTIFSYSPDSISSSPINAGTANYGFQITDSFGCTYDTSLNVVVLPLTHPDCYSCQGNITPLSDTTMCDNGSLVLDASFTGITNREITFESYPLYPFGYSNHPPNNSYESPMNVTSIIPSVISNASTQLKSVCIDIDSDYNADLHIFLKSPNGTLIKLVEDVGGSSDNYRNTCFKPTASVNISAGTAPFTGDFLPQENFNLLNGSPINGTWKLLVSDDTGITKFDTLNHWSITFETNNNITYTWTPSATLSCNNCPTPTANPTSSTTYTVQAVDSYNCINRDTAVVNIVNTYPAPDITCAPNGSTSMDISWTSIPNVSSYEINIDNSGWTTPNATLSHTINGLIPGQPVDIQVRVSNSILNCGVEIANETCNFCLLSAVLLDTLPPSCYGFNNGQLTLNAIDGATPYSFILDQSETNSTGSFTDLTSGYHQVELIDFSGCKDTIDFILSSPDSLHVNYTTDTISCYGANDGKINIIANGGTGSLNYNWSSSNSGANIQGLNPGTYTVTVSDQNNCFISKTIEVIEPIELTNQFTTENITCNGFGNGVIQINTQGGSAPYNYSWSDSHGNISGSNDFVPGNYQVTVTDSRNCSTIVSALNITEPSLINININQTVIGCNDGSGSALQASAVGGTGQLNYNWANSNTSISNNLSSGTYIVTVTDGNSCTSTKSYVVNELEAIAITSTDNNPTCFGFNNGSIAINTVTGGIGSNINDYTYRWNTTPIQTSSTATLLSAGTQYFVTVTDQQGCSNTFSLGLTEPAPVTLVLQSKPVSCFGFSDGEAYVSNVSSDAPPFQFIWNNSQVNDTLINMSAGIYSVTATDADGCTSTKQIEIISPEQLTIELSYTNASCSGSSTGQINTEINGGTTPYNYFWSNGQTDDHLQNIGAGSYTVTVTDNNDCSLERQIEIADPPPLSASYNITDPTCYNKKNAKIEILPLGGTPPFRYALDNDALDGANIKIGLTSGDHILQLIDVNGCYFTDTIFIANPPQIIVDAGSDITVKNLDLPVQLNVIYSNTVGQNVQIQWLEPYPGILDSTTIHNPLANPNNNVYLVVSVKDENNCIGYDTLFIKLTTERGIAVPTAFTPNADSNNDLLMVHGLESITVTDFLIFDRWGEMVYQYNTPFHPNNNNIGWNGQ
ncbi:MAG: proprotein convertase P-domain-containing protein, partial [Saprospiraceae bacterium]|nr:proprotein convertase P-domain-containing protein [Saprospiraceae bacterium]